jgi:2,3-bisphosphoglycerate-dependent phosphoglycerate mutase
MKKLVIIRHGQSEWNLQNRFTGWADVNLTAKGIEEAKKAGETLGQAGFRFGLAYTSYLKRAIKTLWLLLEEMDQMSIPIHNSWRLNEKHYGTLTGLNKAETAEKYGEDQVKLWRRGFAIAPPELDPTSPHHPCNDKKYDLVNRTDLPGTESLKNTIDRIMPYWNQTIVPSFQQHNEILIAAHGNSLRGIVMHLKNLSEEQILEVNIPTGIPYVFELTDQMQLIKDYYLADQAELEKLMNEVASQGKTK